MRAELESGYVLHSRPYGDTSVIINCFTQRYGRIPLIAKGVRNKKIKQRQYIQPFTPLLLSWQGKSTLKTLINVEIQGVLRHLSDRRLYSAFYVNELMMRLLPEHDDHPLLFEAYEAAIEQLYGSADLEAVLRRFEFSLLEELGYGVNFSWTASGDEIQANEAYCYVEELGFVRSGAVNRAPYSLTGAVLSAIALGDYQRPEVRRGAKQLSRQMFKPLLGHRPLASRKLFNNLTVKESLSD